MYAIIENGNKQYKVAEGDVVRVEKLKANEGETVSFNTLMISERYQDGRGSCRGQSNRYGRKAGQGQEDHRLQV